VYAWTNGRCSSNQVAVYREEAPGGTRLYRCSPHGPSLIPLAPATCKHKRKTLCFHGPSLICAVQNMPAPPSTPFTSPGGTLKNCHFQFLLISTLRRGECRGGGRVRCCSSGLNFQEESREAIRRRRDLPKLLATDSKNCRNLSNT